MKPKHRKFSHLAVLRRNACLERIGAMHKSGLKGSARDHAELLMWERYRRSQ